ncbi:MAG: Smr/MutS family protein [Desulfamplus sp.]|nr:Smr/MutS family protein [Desulfamplus sp.]
MNRDRNGIVVLNKNQDIFNLFIEKASLEKSSIKREYSQQGDIANQEQENINEQYKRELRFDKNGMPFLDKGQSLYKIFTDTDKMEKYKNRERDYNLEEKDDSEDNDKSFFELIEASLKGKNRDDMMREKSDKPLPDPIPLKKRLKRYPPPQDEIDLHGYTSKEAESKTETYLRNCWRDGLFTVQVIVGRGIHSPYGAVLPDLVEDLLIRLKREGIALWFEWDRRTKSQSGSIIVYLKQF